MRYIGHSPPVALRLRPILMTTLTTVFGMTPLAIGMGEGAEIMSPLALAVVGGLACRCC